MKRNWTQKVSSYFISYSKGYKGYKTATFFKDIEFVKKNKIRDIVLKEE